MIEVLPKPDELSVGHEGRIVWVNGCGTSSELNGLMRAALIKRGTDISNLPKLHLLALHSGMSTTEYAASHSMLPVLRVAARTRETERHGDVNALSYSRRLGMLTQRQGAYCCNECIQEDLQQFEFRSSWYRRTHHLIGVDWCPVHGCALSRIDSKNAFSRMPHIWLAEGKLKAISSCLERLPNEGFLRRYTEVAEALLKNNRPYAAETINARLAKRAQDIGLRTSRNGRRPLLSDQLIDCAPIAWLQHHLQGFNSKASLIHFNRIDGLLSTKTLAGTGDAYAMAMAVLYDSAEEAMLDASISEASKKADCPKSKAVKRGSKFWQGEAWSYYLRSRGVISEMANALQVDRTHLGETLTELGLPSLHDIEYSAKWRAFLRFCSGQSMIESCSQEKIEVIELEDLLRNCSTRVHRAIKKIRV